MPKLKYSFISLPIYYGVSYKKDNVSRDEFSRFLEAINGNKLHRVFYLVPQWRYLCDDHKRLLVDFVGHYGNLQEDWGKVCSILDMHEDLQYLNVGKQLPYKEFYTDETRTKVAQLYEEDIKMFNYEY